MVPDNGAAVCDRERKYTAEEVEQAVYQIVCEQFGLDRPEISRETSYGIYFDEGPDQTDIDSTEITMEFEDTFYIEIPQNEAEKQTTVGLSIDYIKRELTKQGRMAA